MILENLSTWSIITNCAIIYFTSNTYKLLFVDNNDPFTKTDEVWDAGKFFMIVVAIEHGLMFLKQWL
jgi:hypothetical protein